MSSCGNVNCVGLLFKRFLCLSFLISLTSGYLYPIEPRGPLRGTPSPPGTPWPLPHVWRQNSEIVTIGTNYAYQLMNPGLNCTPLNWFVEKFNHENLFGSAATPDQRFPTLSTVEIEITSPDTLCNSFPKLGDDETYSLTITSNQVTTATAKISAFNVWGVLRGLSTFIQLPFDDLEDREQNGLHYYVNVTEILDWARFPHRGLMIDTARHYQPEKVIHQLIDAMFHNKLNVLHWHIVDDQSFPFVSTRLPELSVKGAYNKKAIYTPEMVNRTLEFARLRGVRVIFEFDTPGHTNAMGKGYPELLTPCFGDGENPGTPDYPNHASYENLDPTRETTYEIMRELFAEISQVSQDEYVHLGMDEVYYPCWNSSPAISAFMLENGYVNLSQVQAHYTVRHIHIAKQLSIKPIVWQDPMDAGVELDTDVVIQIWKDWAEGDWPNQTQMALDKGHRVLLSAPWCINYINYGESWRAYFLVDPILQLPNMKPGQDEQVLGGEACIWGEFVDQTNILPRLFPFVGAVAERLWSSPPINFTVPYVDDAMWRLDQHRCRLLRRGIPAQPILNGYCGEWETEL